MSSSIKERRVEAADAKFSADLGVYMRTGLWEQCKGIEQVLTMQNGDYVIEFTNKRPSVVVQKGKVTDGHRKGDSVTLKMPVGISDTSVLPDARREQIQDFFDHSPDSTRQIDTLLTVPSKLPNDAYMHVLGHMRIDDHLEVYIQSEISPMDRRTLWAVGRQLTHILERFPDMLAHMRGTFGASFEPKIHI